MCDELDDERMRVIWRMLAQQNSLLAASSEETEESDPVLPTVRTEPSPAKPRMKSLVR